MSHSHAHGHSHPHDHPHGRTRRHAARHADVELYGVTAVRIRPGHAASIVNISDRGALLDTTHRLLPGHSVELSIQTRTDRISVRARVVRCEVLAVAPASITYRGAVSFDRHLASLAVVPSHSAPCSPAQD